MRVIAGSRKGRRLMGPDSVGLRPTSDRVKEALFSILSPRIIDARFLDLYAGTGAIGIEALSRGARHVTFVESSSVALRVLKKNLEQCGFAAAGDVRICTAERFLKGNGSETPPYDIVFADPPYDQKDGGQDLMSRLNESEMIGAHTLVILEHAKKVAVPVQVGRLSQVRQYRYGDTTLSLYQTAEGPSA
ncbi:MAG TPA: 16S rRNA (guanine(966)-N(2))-methyltransferase RsmD [Nitrospiraceae bacterium]|nr:16S rRNA (guanine(966)-N(2))-methyltransferase RsmD [Nitrospiraceae bacterium]